MERSGISFGCCCCCTSFVKLFKSIPYTIYIYILYNTRLWGPYFGVYLYVCLCMYAHRWHLQLFFGDDATKTWLLFFFSFLLLFGGTTYRRFSSWRGSAGMRNIMCSVHQVLATRYVRMFLFQHNPKKLTSKIIITTSRTTLES